MILKIRMPIKEEGRGEIHLQQEFYLDLIIHNLFAKAVGLNCLLLYPSLELMYSFSPARSAFRVWTLIIKELWKGVFESRKKTTYAIYHVDSTYFA